MNSLHALQQDLQDYILLGAAPILKQVVGTDKVGVDIRLGIYANGYRLRLLEVLETDYPGVKALLDDSEAFYDMGREYIEIHPSPYFNVRWYGDCLPEFLRTTPRYCNRAVLAEMAAFEWAMTLAFDAPDQPVASIDTVARLSPASWPNMQFTAHAAVQRLDLRWNVPTLWNNIDAQDEPGNVEENEYPIAWLLWRKDLKIYFRSLNVDEAWAIDAMTKGASFGEICEGLCEWVDAVHVAPHAAAMLKRWLADGLITEIVCNS